jgi:hypothetical protein
MLNQYAEACKDYEGCFRRARGDKTDQARCDGDFFMAVIKSIDACGGKVTNTRGFADDATCKELAKK